MQRRPRGLLLVLAGTLFATQPYAQDAAPAASGHPSQVATMAAIADVRAFAVARAGDRALVAYIQANDPQDRGALRVARLHAIAVHGGLDRLGDDANLAPSAFALALAWDGATGAVVYTVPRPHRGERPGAHRQRPGATERALNNPLGASALTAADIVLQRLDARGEPLGRPVLVFEENSRAFRVALARDGEAWVIAWTGGITVDGEVQGTVRFSRVATNGRAWAARAAASDTGFVGQVGDALRVLSPDRLRTRPWIVWTGDRCAALEGTAPLPVLQTDPSEAAGVRPGEQRFQHAPNEHAGPPIVSDPRRLFAVESRPDGTASAIVAGPWIATDACAVASGPDGATIEFAAMLSTSSPALSEVSVERLGVDRPTIRASAPLPVRVVEPNAESSAAPGEDASLIVTPSRVPPPPAPTAEEILARPTVLDATRAGTSLIVAGVSPTRARVVVTRFDRGDTALHAITLLAPRQPVRDVSLATSGTEAPWLFMQVGGIVGGPLVFADLTSPTLHNASNETVWAGDERFREQLLRARAARAAYTSVEGVFGPLSERADVATNPRMPHLVAQLRHLRSQWAAACEPLAERAHFLVRHGVDETIRELAREQCELPSEPVVPIAPVPPGP